MNSEYCQRCGDLFSRLKEQTRAPGVVCDACWEKQAEEQWLWNLVSLFGLMLVVVLLVRGFFLGFELLFAAVFR